MIFVDNSEEYHEVKAPKKKAETWAQEAFKLSLR
jgi:hypothetical protein